MPGSPFYPSTETRFTTSSGGIGGRSGSGDYSGSGSSSSTWTPSGQPMPTYQAGKFAAPVYDKKRVGALAQRFQSAGIRKLQTEVRRAGNEAHDNPNAKRMVMRDALAGYGQGLENVAEGAYKAALGQYNEEYGHAWNENMTNFNAGEDAKQANFKASIESWMKQGTATTQSTSSKTSNVNTAGAGMKTVYGKGNVPMTVPNDARMDSSGNWVNADGTSV